MEWSLERTKQLLIDHHNEFNGIEIKEEPTDEHEIRFVRASEEDVQPSKRFKCEIGEDAIQLMQVPIKIEKDAIKEEILDSDDDGAKVNCDNGKRNREPEGVIIQCKQCTKKYKNKKSLAKHTYKTHSGKHTKKYECDECNNKFKQWNQLSRHKNTHLKKESFECKFCNKKFGYMTQLQRHERAQHENESIECEFCDNNFSSSAEMVVHIRTEHFYSMEEKERLEEVFQGIRTFECFKCRYQSANYYDVQKHITRCQVDPLELELKCPICMNKFTTKSNLIQHMKNIHEKNGTSKVYKCDSCDKTFGRNDHLLRHKKTHLKVKPFECHICKKRFTQKRYLNRHMQNIHKKDEKLVKVSQVNLESSLKSLHKEKKKMERDSK